MAITIHQCIPNVACIKHYEISQKRLPRRKRYTRVTFRCSKIVRGQIVAPEEDGMRLTKPIKPFVQAARGMPVSWFSDTLPCDEDGNFEILIPKEGKVELRAGAQNYSYSRITATLGKADLGQIELFQGVEVFGRIVDLDSKPVANVVVRIEENWKGSETELDGMSFGFSSSAKTNENGEYRLPPHRNKCRINIEKHGRIRGTNESIKTAPHSPLFARSSIMLSSESETEKEFNITAAETVRVRGTIRWPDGRPAEGVKVGYQNDFKKTETDKNGQYELSVIKDEEESHLHSMGARGPNGNWFYSHSLSDIGMQHLRAKHGGKTLEGADWELRPRKDLKMTRYKEEDAALDEISDRFNIALKKYNEVAKNERIPWGIPYHADERAPFDAFTTELVNFEKKFPGGFSGLMALKNVLEWGNQGAVKAKQQREAMIERMFDAYLEHPDLHLLIYKLRPEYVRDFLPRPFDPKLPWGMTLERLRREGKSPRVEATFLHSELERWFQTLEAFRWAESVDWKVPKRVNPTYFANLKDVDPEDLMNRVKSNAKKLNELYAEVPEFRPMMEILLLGGKVKLRDQHYDSTNPMRSTFAKSAAAMVFDLTEIQPGKPVPDVTGKDENGKTVSLKDFDGKSILLFFNYSHTTDSYGNLYESAREWKKKYKNKSFEVVSVMMDFKVEKTKQLKTNGDITWPTICDIDRSISNRWNMAGVPADLFLIDSKGVIKERLKHRDLTDAKIDDLVGGDE